MSLTSYFIVSSISNDVCAKISFLDLNIVSHIGLLIFCYYLNAIFVYFLMSYVEYLNVYELLHLTLKK